MTGSVVAIVTAIGAVIASAGSLILQHRKQRAEDDATIETLKREAEADLREWMQDEFRRMRGEIQTLRSEVSYLRSILRQHGITYDPWREAP